MTTQPSMKSTLMDRTGLLQDLRSLVDEAKRYPKGDPRRQKALTQAIRILSTVLWREHSSEYNDALQLTFEFFCRNVDSYNPNRGSVVNWLNHYLRWRLIDLRQPQQEIPFSQFSPDSDRTDPPFANIPDRVNRDALAMLEHVREWAKTDSTGELKKLYPKKYPQVTAQFLILHRLPPATSWETLSTRLNVKVPTLSAFYQRHCLPRLREFGKAEGYL